MRIRPSHIVQVGARTMVPTLVVVSAFLLVVGHDAPGGGFVGGLLAGAAVLVAFLAGGGRAVRRMIPVPARVLVGSGIGVATLTAFAGLVFGRGWLDAGKAVLDLGPVGEISVGSALIFDLGVYLVVLGLVLTIVEHLGTPEEQGS